MVKTAGSQRRRVHIEEGAWTVEKQAAMRLLEEIIGTRRLKRAKMGGAVVNGARCSVVGHRERRLGGGAISFISYPADGTVEPLTMCP